MKLREYQRIQFNKYLLPKIKDEKCDICGSDSNLEVHHNKLFSEMLYESLQMLDFTEKDTNEYSENELKLITYVMLGIQAKNTYKTLCDECHDKLHESSKHENFKYYYIKKENQKSQENILLSKYLDSIIGVVMLNLKDRKDLIDKLNFRNGGRQRKSAATINVELLNRGIGYKIKEFSTSRIINGKKKNYKNAWKIIEAESI